MTSIASQYEERVKTARDFWLQNMHPQTILSVERYLAIVVRPRGLRDAVRDFKQYWKSIAVLQENGVPVIVPKLHHKFVRSEHRSEQHNPDHVEITTPSAFWHGFQPELTLIKGRDWMTLSAPLFQGKTIKQQEIVNIVDNLSQFAEKLPGSSSNACCICLICILTIPCLCYPACYLADKESHSMHEKLARKVADINKRTLHQHGLQLNYHAHPAKSSLAQGSWAVAMHYLTLTSTAPEFPEVCLQEMPANEFSCACCGVEPTIPGKTFSS